MPIQGIPQVLEQLLESVLSSHAVSTWNVYSEINNGVTFRIRFSQTEISSNIDQIDIANSDSVCYRRKPPSQVKRDRTRRALGRRNQNSYVQSNDSLDRQSDIIANEEAFTVQKDINVFNENYVPPHEDIVHDQVKLNNDILEIPMDTSSVAENANPCQIKTDQPEQNLTTSTMPVGILKFRPSDTADEEEPDESDNCSDSSENSYWAESSVNEKLNAKLDEICAYLGHSASRRSDLEDHGSEIRNYKLPDA